MSDQWYYTQQGQQVGPVSLDQLKSLAGSGQLTPPDLVWNDSLSNWIPADQALNPDVFSVGRGQAIASSSPIAVVQYQSPSQSAEVIATARAIDLLRQTKPWVRLISILMFVGAGLMIVGGLVMMIAMGVSGIPNGPPVFIFAMYLAMGVLYVAPAVFLSRYASNINQLLTYRMPQYLESSLEAQKSFWKFVGIVAIIILCLYILGIGAAALFAVLR